MFGYQEYIKGNQYRRAAKANMRRARFLRRNKTAVTAGMGASGGALAGTLAHHIVKKHEQKTGKPVDNKKKLAIIGAATLAGGAAGTAVGHYGGKALVKQQLKSAAENKAKARKMYAKGALKTAVHGAATIAAVHTLAPGAITAAGAKAIALGKAGIHALGPHVAALAHWGAAHAVPAAKVTAGGLGLHYINKKIDKA